MIGKQSIRKQSVGNVKAVAENQLDHFINGRTALPSNGLYLDGSNPKNGRVISRVARGNAADVDAAVRAAEFALTAWRNMRPSARGRILNEIARKIRERINDFTVIECRETGKSASMAKAEIEATAQYFEFYGGLVNAIQGNTIDIGVGYHSYTRREPFGVVGAILPWNAPLNQAGRACAPALAAGNTVVAKPSEATSGSLLELARMAVEECGLEAGVFNVVTGLGKEAGESMVQGRAQADLHRFSTRWPRDRPNRRRTDFTTDLGTRREIAGHRICRCGSGGGGAGGPKRLSPSRRTNLPDGRPGSRRDHL
nr:aldehyde dehydrogenase family protein [Methylocapsa sp. S129]